MWLLAAPELLLQGGYHIHRAGRPAVVPIRPVWQNEPKDAANGPD